MAGEAQQTSTIDFDTATDDQLAALRGDHIAEADEPATQDPAPETDAAEPESKPATAGPEGETASAEEPEGEPAAAAEPEPQPQEHQQSFMIPKSRYDAVMARLKAMEQAQAQQAQAQPTAQPLNPQEQSPVDVKLARIDEIDALIGEAVKDGDGAAAAKLMRESRTLQQEIFDLRMQESQAAVSGQTMQSVRYDAFVSAVERVIPEVNPDSDQYDEGLALEVLDLKEAFQARGLDSITSLTRALNYVRPGWDQPQRAEPAAAPAAAPAPAPAPRKTDVQKNLADARSQPPSMTAGTNSDTAGIRGKINVMKLPDKDFENLTEDQLAELRGDHF